jgi:hypothetical protein
MKRVVASLVTVAVLGGASVAVAAPAQARDTSWGCGGACKVVGK